MNRVSSVRRPSRNVSPRKLRKHSDIVSRNNTVVAVGGIREKTETGFRVAGSTTKSFETYYETMLAGTSSPVLKNPKKDRVLRVISGYAYILTRDENGENQQKAIAGDEVVLLRGTEYRISTSKESVSFFVCQGAKYAVSLEVVDESTLYGTEVAPELLVEPTYRDRLLQTRPQDLQTQRRGSRAAEQLSRMRANRKEPEQIVAERYADSGVAPETANQVAGINARPSGGKFDPEGAG